jgi:hypothetical protein
MVKITFTLIPFKETQIQMRIKHIKTVGELKAFLSTLEDSNRLVGFYDHKSYSDGVSIQDVFVTEQKGLDGYSEWTKAGIYDEDTKAVLYLS